MWKSIVNAMLPAFLRKEDSAPPPPSSPFALELQRKQREAEQRQQALIQQQVDEKARQETAQKAEMARKLKLAHQSGLGMGADPTVIAKLKHFMQEQATRGHFKQRLDVTSFLMEMNPFWQQGMPSEYMHGRITEDEWNAIVQGLLASLAKPMAAEGLKVEMNEVGCDVTYTDTRGQYDIPYTATRRVTRPGVAISQ